MPDSDRVGAAVRFINSRRGLRGVALAREVGGFVATEILTKNGRGQPVRPRSRPARLRALLARNDLPFKAGTIHCLVRVHDQLREIPVDVADDLSLSHHRALLPLPAGALKQKLARAAATEGWTRERLEAEVRRHLSPARVGRKPIDPIARLVRELKRVTAQLENEVQARDSAPTPNAGSRRVGNELRGVVRSLQGVLADLRG